MTVDDAQVSLENAESPVSEPAMNLGNDQPEEGATAEPAVPTPAPVEVPVPVSADIQKIDDLAKRLDALAQTVEGGGAAAPSAAVQNDMAALRRDLQDLMARLTALEQDRASQGVTTAPSVQPAPEPPAAAMPDTSVSVEPPVQKPVSHGDAAPALKRPNLILRSVVGGAPMWRPV
jgi:hypothetical protein